MFGRRTSSIVAVAFLAGCACARSQGKAEPSPVATTSVGGESNAGPGPGAGAEATAATAIDPAALVGVWAEYWSVAGGARTAQHAFAADGRWSWQAAEDVASGVVRRSGRWTVEGDVLRLRVDEEYEQASCAPAPCTPAAPRRIDREPPLVEELVLGACPPNQEAHALDARYECRSLDGRAYWRRAEADPGVLLTSP